MRDPRCASAAALALLLVVAGVARAQAPATASAPFGESVDVELIEVEVFVADAHGQPVTGLTAGDFMLKVDREARPIASLYESNPRAELSPATLSTAPGDPTASAPALPASPASTSTPPQRQLSLVVLLDELHMQPGGRKRTLDRIAPMLEERVAAGDKVMIATYGRSLQVRRPFEATGPIAADLAQVHKRPTGGVHGEIQRRQTLSQIRDLYASRGCQALDEMRAIASTWAVDVESESLATLETLESLLHGLGGRSGRKALLLVSDGLSLTPGLEAELLLIELCGGRPTPSTGLVGPLSRVTRAANAAQVTLYTLDSGGQRVLASAVDAGPGLSMANVGEVRADSQDPGFALAADTGGKALLESNKPEFLVADLAQDIAAFYSLAFAPRAGDAGRAHRIKVEVKRPGVRVRHRSAWDPQPPEAKLNGRVLAALRFGGEEQNPLAARLEVGAPKRESDGNYTVPLRLLVPATGLTLVPRGERRQGSLRVLVAVQDGEGRTTPVRGLPLPVDLAALPEGTTADPAQVPLELRLKLRAGRNVIAVAVHDEVGQDTSVVRREVTVGAPAR
ncbi:MAG TPA: VWA domain-containing protein [Thermoanaerobaculia bacterium]|nr:VWA domain-containing protein [Thermoanaerobaculia bacterium]